LVSNDEEVVSDYEVLVVGLEPSVSVKESYLVGKGEVADCSLAPVDTPEEGGSGQVCVI